MIELDNISEQVDEIELLIRSFCLEMCIKMGAINPELLKYIPPERPTIQELLTMAEMITNALLASDNTPKNVEYLSVITDNIELLKICEIESNMKIVNDLIGNDNEKEN